MSMMVEGETRNVACATAVRSVVIFREMSRIEHLIGNLKKIIIHRQGAKNAKKYAKKAELPKESQALRRVN
jgi:hypothetical protein